MPSPTTASKPKKIKCEVLRAIGIDAKKEDIEKWEKRATRKGITFKSDGFTTMIYPNKPEYDGKAKKWLEPEPVFIELDKDVANKLSKVGAVRVDVGSL